MPDFLLPDLGEGLTEAEIVGWLVQVGDEVTIDQPVVEVETAKASVEVPVPFAGTVTVLHAQPGVMVPVGSPLISVTEKETAQASGKGSVEADDGGSSENRSMGGLREPGIEIAPPQPADAKADANAGESSGNVLIGYGTPAVTRSRRRRPGRAGSTTPRTGTPDGGRRAEITTSPPHSQPIREQRLEDANSPVVRVISPLARRIAREAQLDLRLVTGSGPDSLIMRADIRRALEERGPDARSTGRSAEYTEQARAGAAGASAEQAEAAAHSAADSRPTTRSRPADPADGALGFDRLPLTGVRRFAAEKFSRSRREIPEATIWVDADATPFLAARSALNNATHNAVGSSQRSGGAPAHWASPAQPVSLVALLARFVVAGLRRFPELNATVEDGEIHRHHSVHLGFAAQTDRGLVVPVVRHADRLTTRELAAALQQKTAAARDGRITPVDLTGGTFTVNNYGVFGTDGAAAIINHPEAAILGIGRIVDRPWVLDGQLAVRKVTQLTLSFDHRVCDGATAGGLLRFVADCVENPVTALGDL